jgi:phage host-nuclease inhibitor protein Gam
MGNVLDLIATAETYGEPSLPEPIATYEDASDPEVRGGWQIETAASVDWALQRLAECEAEAEAVDAQADAAIARINARRDELKARAARGAGFFRFKLTEYAVGHRSALLTGKKKSRDFVHGRLGFRQKGGRLEVRDRDALLAWLAEQPVEDGLYRMKLEPEMKAIQARFKSANEVPPGCEYTPEYEDVVIEAEAPEAALAKKGE